MIDTIVNGGRVLLFLFRCFNLSFWLLFPTFLSSLLCWVSMATRCTTVANHSPMSSPLNSNNSNNDARNDMAIIYGMICRLRWYFGLCCVRIAGSPSAFLFHLFFIIIIWFCCCCCCCCCCFCPDVYTTYPSTLRRNPTTTYVTSTHIHHISTVHLRHFTAFFKVSILMPKMNSNRHIFIIFQSENHLLNKTKKNS